MTLIRKAPAAPLPPTPKQIGAEVCGLPERAIVSAAAGGGVRRPCGVGGRVWSLSLPSPSCFCQTEELGGLHAPGRVHISPHITPLHIRLEMRRWNGAEARATRVCSFWVLRRIGLRYAMHVAMRSRCYDIVSHNHSESIYIMLQVLQAIRFLNKKNRTRRGIVESR